jgi:hypothetical protein
MLGIFSQTIILPDLSGIAKLPEPTPLRWDAAPFQLFGLFA